MILWKPKSKRKVPLGSLVLFSRIDHDFLKNKLEMKTFGQHCQAIFNPELPIGTQVEIIILIEAPPLETTPHLLRQTNTSQLLPQGVAGNQLLAFAGYIEPDELQKISQAIEEDCAKVDLNEW